MFQTAQSGNTVKVHYTGRLHDGSTFDSSAGREPLGFTLGTGQMIPGFEAAVFDMAVGESKTVEIPAEQAYGPHNPEMIIKFDKSRLPSDLQAQKGQQLTLQQPNGNPMPVIVHAVYDAYIELDANHTLAGKALIFEISLIEIN